MDDDTSTWRSGGVDSCSFSIDVLDGGLNMLIASVRSKPARGKRSPNAKNSKAH